MSTDHLTFLVLAGAMALVTFACGDVPALLLPPALHSADRGRRGDGARTASERAGGSNYHLGAFGLLTAQERRRAGKLQRHRCHAIPARSAVPGDSAIIAN